MLMAVKSETEPAIDQVLYEVRVHVIGMCRHTFSVMMPHGNAQPALIRRLAQPGSRVGDACRVNSAL